MGLTEHLGGTQTIDLNHDQSCLPIELPYGYPKVSPISDAAKGGSIW